MRIIDRVAILVLALTAVGVYAECYLHGVDSSTMSLGVAALVLFLFLAAPWQFQPTTAPANRVVLALLIIALLVAVISELILAYSLAWTALLWLWAGCRLTDASRARVARLLLLALFIFPWIDVDLRAVGWGMRLTGAMVSERAFEWMGYPTTREGTFLLVAGNPVEVNEECDGGQTLHAMLVVGLAAASVYLGPTRSMAPWIPVLAGFAWLANTLRMILIGWAAARFPGAVFFDWIHDVGGWFVIALMMGLCVACFAGWNRFRQAFPTRREQGSESPLSWFAWQRVRDVLSTHWGPRRSSRGNVTIASLLVGAATLGTLWRMVPLPDAEERLQEFIRMSQTTGGQEIGFSDQERRVLGAAQAVKRSLRLDHEEFVVTLIDGTHNRRAVHDPLYCWTVLQSTEIPVPHGNLRVLRVVEEGFERDVMFWYSDGVGRHASPVRYLLQASWRRATWGRLGEEPVLILVEPRRSERVNWFRFLDSFPWILEL